ncbi:MAG: PD40 domain-containing protein [Pyrinomonadaceae bacterium]|nr:PD40 domain-containing protein [Pyrinomonadaceae bacterium]
MKSSVRLSGAGVSAVTLALFLSAVILKAHAQTPSATPDSFVAQITNVPTNTRNAYVGGISGDGRFVVIEATGDIATLKPGESTRAVSNTDGNREIFLFDYVQRRIFQITNSMRALNDPTRPPIDTARPNDFSNITVEVSNNRPSISNDGKWIVFSSNAYVDGNAAANPKSFDGTANRDALRTDGNQEVFLYRIPDVSAVDLSSGAEAAFVDLSTGALTRVTFTTNIVKPQPGTATLSPTVVDDNRYATLNDNGSLIGFVSSRNDLGNATQTVKGGANPDLNPEIIVYNTATRTFLQLTSTANPAGSVVNLIWNANPSFSGNGARLTFISSADEQIANSGAAEPANARGNGEVYYADIDTGATTLASVRRVTSTPPGSPVDANFDSTIKLSPGARLSRNGNLILFESRADIQPNGSISGNLSVSDAIYVYNIGANSFTRITERPAPEGVDVLSPRFPAFAGDGDPSATSIVFSSSLNFRADGQISTSATEGLNPARFVQLFNVPVPTTTAPPNSFTRLTNTNARSTLQAFPSNTVRRIVFSFPAGEFGGGNGDGSSEAYYMLLPSVTSETPAPSPTPSAGPVSYASGASDRPVTTATPLPADAINGLAPGTLTIARATTVSLADSALEVAQGNAREDQRRLPLPIELNGVSVALSSTAANGLRNAAAGLYFVSPGQINFVIPPGLTAGTYTVIINNRGAVIRSAVTVVAAQPDLFTSTNGPAGRAAVLNVTNPLAPSAEPFNITTTRPTADGTGTETVATELMIMLTGVRGTLRTAITVRIGTTDLTGDAIIRIDPSLTAGFDEIRVRLPASLAGAGDVPVIVTVGGVSSRPAETAARIRIN